MQLKGNNRWVYVGEPLPLPMHTILESFTSFVIQISPASVPRCLTLPSVCINCMSHLSFSYKCKANLLADKENHPPNLLF